MFEIHCLWIRSGAILRIGIFGGTFNPVHYGHLINAQAVLEDFNLQAILFLPSKSPVHKELDGNSNHEERLEMLALAINDNKSFDVSRIEIDRDSPSYTITTIQHLQKEFQGAEFFLIIGVDSYNEFHTWKDFRKIIKLVSLIVMKRPGSKPDNKEILDIANEVHFAGNPTIDISSSRIREYIRDGRSIKYLVPSRVEEYIYQNGLYRT